MNVVDSEPSWWFLLEEDGALFLDGNYEASFIGYDCMIQLTEEEAQQYKARGRQFINWLAGDVQDTAPVLKASTSPYKSRRITGALSERALEAIEQWKLNRSAP